MQIPAASSLLVAFLLEVPWVASVWHSSEIRNSCLLKLPSQALLVFHFVLLSLKRKKEHKMKYEKYYTGFHIPKIWKILKNYAGPFHQALTSFIWRVTRLCNLLERSFWQHYPGFELKTRSLITRNPHRFTVFFLKRHKSVILESATSDGFDLWNRVFLTWNQNRKWGWTPIEQAFFFIFDDFHL